MACGAVPGTRLRFLGASGRVPSLTWLFGFLASAGGLWLRVVCVDASVVCCVLCGVDEAGDQWVSLSFF